MSTGLYGVVPKDIIACREQCFTVPSSFTITVAQWELYWPFVDNIWSLNSKSTATEDGIVRVYWNCRQHRTEHWPTPTSKAGESEAPPKKRNKPARLVIGCKIKLIAIWDKGNVQLTLGSGPKEHNHSLRDSDDYKTCSALVSLATYQLSLGHPAAKAYHILSGDTDEEIVGLS